MQDDVEISMEVNPESVSRDTIRSIAGLGVNRFSMGAQSMDNAELRMLGRLHDADRMIAAYDQLRRAGADNVNLDLMYGLPGQSLATWEASLEGVLALAPEHLSLYALTVEESTPLLRLGERGTAAHSGRRSGRGHVRVGAAAPVGRWV